MCCTQSTINSFVMTVMGCLDLVLHVQFPLHRYTDHPTRYTQHGAHRLMRHSSRPTLTRWWRRRRMWNCSWVTQLSLSCDERFLLSCWPPRLPTARRERPGGTLSGSRQSALPSSRACIQTTQYVTGEWSCNGSIAHQLNISANMFKLFTVKDFLNLFPPLSNWTPVVSD